MSANAGEGVNSRTLETILKEHLDNTIECGKALGELFMNLGDPDQHIVRVKALEEKGDELTAEAYRSLELRQYSDFIYIVEQLVSRLDDIVDGINNTARLIDICHSRGIENAAHDILSTLLGMTKQLQSEIIKYPNIDLADMKACCKALKEGEQTADLIYHEWRKKQRRVLVLSLIEENNWTEILGVLEQTTDAAYHAGLLLERMVRYQQK
ncbi:DUF47 domain-containing protein [Methylomonas sp. MgM2]